MSDITVINDSEQSSLVTNGLAKNGELYLKAEGSTDAGAIVVYDSGAWRTFANEVSSDFANAYSVSFDGSNDYMQTSSDTALGSASAFTLAVWFKTSDTDGGKEAIISMGTSTYFAIRTIGSNVEIREASGGTTIGQHSTTGWNFAVVVHDGTTLKGSLNGASFVTRTPQYTLPQSGYNTPLAVGRLISYGQYFPGLVDEAAYWTSALSFSDVTAMYNSGVPTDISSYSPVGWWRMGDDDSGTGTTITDQGSGSNDGTLTNGPTFSSDVPS